MPAACCLLLLGSQLVPTCSLNRKLLLAQEEAEAVPLAERDVREALRCVRLQVFDKAQSMYALESGYFEHPWLDDAGTEAGGNRKGVRRAGTPAPDLSIASMIYRSAHNH